MTIHPIVDAMEDEKPLKVKLMELIKTRCHVLICLALDHSPANYEKCFSANSFLDQSPW